MKSDAASILEKKSVMTSVVDNETPSFDMDQETLLTDSAFMDILMGRIPDLYPICVELLDTFLKSSLPYSALQFVPVLNKMPSFKSIELKILLEHPETRHVLIDNELLKIILILWQPGEQTDIHGHPKDGCVFRVLNGCVDELRYSTERKQNLLGKSTYHAGSMAYIDDELGYHSIHNPYKEAAVTLHVYMTEG